MVPTEAEADVAEFTSATNRHDDDAMLALVFKDVAFDGTTLPDGARIDDTCSTRRA